MGSRSEILASARAAISVPDVVASPLGDLHFFDGVPALESVGTIYDLLDLVRGIEVYLNTIPGASVRTGCPWRHTIRRITRSV